MEKKCILVVSFGTSIISTFENCIKSTENKIKENFPQFEIRRAFTSYMIIKKLKEENKMYIDTVEEALEKMKLDGFTEVYVQPLHIMPGDEYDKIIAGVSKYKDTFNKIVLGRPILYRENDYGIAIEALKTQLPIIDKNKAVVLMGHGTAHPANASYSMLQYMLEDKKLKNVYVATVEGYPTLENIISKMKLSNINEITLMPFMLVAGDHAMNDMAGEENSWKTKLETEGFKINVYLHGLGENKAFQDIYVQHVRDCINDNPLLV